MNEQDPQHPIDPFLTVWFASGGADGFDLRCRVYQALGIEGRWDRERLRLTLRSLLAIYPEEIERFERTFSSFFPEEKLPEYLQRRLAGEEVAGVTWDLNRALADLRQAVPPETRSEQAQKVGPWRKRAFQACAGLLLLIALLSVVLSKTIQGESHKADAAGEATQSIVDGGVRTDGATAGVGADGLNAPPKTASSVKEEPPLYWLQWVVGAALYVCIFLGFAFAGWHKERQWRREQKEGEGEASFAVLGSLDADCELDLRGTEAPQPLSEHELDVLGYQTGLVMTSERLRLDLDATVKATVRSGGVLEPRYRPAGRPGCLQVVMLHKPDAISAALVDCFVNGIRRRGVEVILGADAEQKSDLRLIFVNAATLGKEGPAQLAQWLEQPHSALVEARDPGLWGTELGQLPVGVHSPDFVGLLAALSAARSGRQPNPILASSHTSDLARLTDALPLAAACALAQPCDLATADQLRRQFTPRLPFSRLQRLLLLDGILADPAGWRFRQDLTEWLVARAGEDFRKQVLTWQERRLRRIPAPLASRAAMARERELALVHLQLALVQEDKVDEAAVRSSLASLVAQVGNESLARRVQERSGAIARLVSMPADIARRVQPQLKRLRMEVTNKKETDAPAAPPSFGDVQPHRNIFLGALQLAWALFMRPVAWRRYVARLDPQLDPLLHLANLSREQLGDPQIRRLLLQVYLIFPCFLLLTPLGMTLVAGIKENRHDAIIASLIMAMPLSFPIVGMLGGITASLLGFCWVYLWLLFMFFESRPLVLSENICLFIGTCLIAWNVPDVLSLDDGKLPNMNDVSKRRYMGSLLLGILAAVGAFGLLVGISEIGYAWHRSDYIRIVTLALLAQLVISLTLFLQQVPLRRALIVSFGLSLLGGLIAFIILYINPRGDFGVGIIIGLLFASCGALGLTLPQAVFRRIGRVRFSGIILVLILVLAALTVSLPDRKYGPILGTVMGLLFGWSQRYWGRVLASPLLAVWNNGLAYADSRRARSPSLLRWHSAFWDESNPRPLRGLDRHLQLIMRRDSKEGRAAAAYLAQTPQRWAVSTQAGDLPHEQPPLPPVFHDELLLLGRTKQWQTLEQVLHRAGTSTLVLIPAAVGEGSDLFLAGALHRLPGALRCDIVRVRWPWLSEGGSEMMNAPVQESSLEPFAEALALAFGCSVIELAATLAGRLSQNRLVIVHDPIDPHAYDVVYGYYTEWLPVLLASLGSRGVPNRLDFIQPVRWVETPFLVRYMERLASILDHWGRSGALRGGTPPASERQQAWTLIKSIRKWSSFQPQLLAVDCLPELKPLTTADLLAIAKQLGLSASEQALWLLQVKRRQPVTEELLKELVEKFHFKEGRYE